MLWYVSLMGILAYEGFVLHSAAREGVAPFYPTSADQVEYLTEGYTGYELLRDGGVATGTMELLQQPRAQGFLAQAEAAFLFLGTGASRLPALDLNIGFFVLYLAVTTLTVRSVLGVAPGLASIGLIVSAKAVTAPQGGVFDFRLDLQAMCLWGVLVVLAVLRLGRSHCDGRLRVPLTWAAVWLCLTRIIATTYVGLFLALLLGLSFYAGRRPVSGFRAAAVRRTLLTALAASFVAATCFIVQNWTILSAYYVGGHVLGDEKHLRALEAGVTNALSSLAFYPVSLLRDQAGLGFIGCAAFLAIVSGLMILTSGPDKVLKSLRTDRLAVRWTAPALLFALLTPYMVLTADESKSGVVASVLLPALVLGTACVFAVGCKESVPPVRGRRLATSTAGAVVLLVGGAMQWRQLQNGVNDPRYREQMADTSEFMADVGDYVRETRAGHASWAADAHFDFESALVTRVYYYEQHHVWLDLLSNLGDGPIATTVSPDQVLRQAASSDVLVLTTGGETQYPYDLSVEPVKPALFELARQQYRLLKQFKIYGINGYAFVR